MRPAILLLAGLIAASIFACGDNTETARDAGPPATQDQAPLLAEGEFIDSRPIGGGGTAWISIPGGLPGVVGRADAVVLAEITDVVDTIERPMPAPPNYPVAEVEDHPVTIYSASVEQWVKGSGPGSILITQFGGVTASGPRFTDGDFLLQPGRAYVVSLMDKDKLEDVPGPGGYVKMGLGLGAFEVTDGFVHVLNNPLTKDLQEEFGGMPVADFLDIVRDFVANPPPSPTPLPAGAPEPTHAFLLGRTAPVIAALAIDTEINGASPNSATSLGSRRACNTIAHGDALTVDITADAVLAVSGTGGGISGFQFTLVYDPGILKVAASNHNMLLAANAGSSLFSLGDAVPDDDGRFLVAVGDFGESTTPESGSGVLARITLEAVGRGASALTLSDVTVIGAPSSPPYTIGRVLAAHVAVDAPCPP